MHIFKTNNIYRKQKVKRQQKKTKALKFFYPIKLF